jgi:transcriptional regulator with XRE-family HTH domain
MLTITFRIRELRGAKGWSQTELASAAKVTQATVSRIETGKVELLDLEAFERIADALEVDAAVLIRHDRGRRKRG